MLAYIFKAINDYTFGAVKNYFKYQPAIEYKKQTLPKKTRQSVWLLNFGTAQVGKCFTCGEQISFNNWHCSHVIAEIKGGKCEVDNLRPCCASCNLKMGNQNLYTFARDNNLQGRAKRELLKYFEANPSQINDKRTK